MKLDKETLVKHQFWLLLGLSGVLTLAALVVLFLGPRAKAGLERKKFDAAKKTLDPRNAANRDPKNDRYFLPPWIDRRKFFTKHKNKVWGEAWKTQSDIMTWPPALARLEREGVYFGDDIPAAERLSYRQTYYDQQFTPKAFFAPEGGADVDFPVTHDPVKIFGRHVWDKTKPAPSVEECWMAQEDIWVRREILKVLQHSLRTMGQFKPVREPLWRQAVPAAAGPALDVLVHSDPRAKVSREFTGVRLESSTLLAQKLSLMREDVYASYVRLASSTELSRELSRKLQELRGDYKIGEDFSGVRLETLPPGTLPIPGKKQKQLTGIKKSLLFRSHNWEVNLLLEKPNTASDLRISALSTIKNISPDRRALALNNGGRDLRLRFRQGDGPGSPIYLKGELLRWGESAEFKESFTPNIDLTKDFDLEEDFDPATSPIKVLEELKVGSDAIYNRFVAGGFEMQKGRTEPKQKAAENPEAPSTPAQGGMPNRPQGGSPQGGSPQGAMPPGMKGPTTSDSKDLTPNGFNRLRYVLSKEIEPVRRIPVAFTVVVDQAYRNEVLAAVANSRLRIQTTQVYWVHRDYKPPTGAGIVPGYVPPDRYPMTPPGRIQPIGPRRGSGQGIGPPRPGGVDGPRRDSSGGPSGPGSTSPGPGSTLPGTKLPPPADSGAAANRNLVALTVHGVAALFERYPAKQKKTEGENPNATK